MVNEHLRLTQSEFIRRSLSVHGNKYDYSKAVYVNYGTDVLITCRTCGKDFSQNPASHYKGSGCPFCKNVKNGIIKAKRAGEQFTTKAQKVHGIKYNYSHVKYVSAHDKVTILCNRCNKTFNQSPTDHLSGSGCPNCAPKRTPYSKEEFIEKARSVHGNKYDYSKTVYINNGHKVIITCPKHGDFSQNPNNHISGRGCVKCRFQNTKIVMTEKRLRTLEKARQSYLSAGSKLRLTTEQFVEASRKVHGNKYNYDKSVYRDAKSKVTIACPKHGEFTQSAGSHMYGIGCPKCSSSKGEVAIAQCLDAIGITYEQEKKFPECKDKRPLQFDFYFVYKGVKFLVEYHGIHHSQPVKFFEQKGHIKHEWYKRHDQIKRDFAKNNNFVMIEIWHTVDNVGEYLISQINSQFLYG